MISYHNTSKIRTSLFQCFALEQFTNRAVKFTSSQRRIRLVTVGKILTLELLCMLVSYEAWLGWLKLDMEGGWEVISKPVSFAVAWDKADWQGDEIKLVTYTLWSEIFILFPFKGTLPKSLRTVSLFFFSSLEREGVFHPPTPYTCKLFELVITSLRDLQPDCF